MRLRALFLLAAVNILAVAAAPSLSQARQTVNFSEYSAGTIVIKTNQRRLYYVMGGGKAIAYPVGVGRAGKSWAGTSFISRKVLRPDWAPPAEVKRDKPRMPDLIRGGTPGNPMGAAATTRICRRGGGARRHRDHRLRGCDTGHFLFHIPVASARLHRPVAAARRDPCGNRAPDRYRHRVLLVSGLN